MIRQKKAQTQQHKLITLIIVVLVVIMGVWAIFHFHLIDKFRWIFPTFGDSDVNIPSKGASANVNQKAFEVEIRYDSKKDKVIINKEDYGNILLFPSSILSQQNEKDVINFLLMDKGDFIAIIFNPKVLALSPGQVPGSQIIGTIEKDGFILFSRDIFSYYTIPSDVKISNIFGVADRAIESQDGVGNAVSINLYKSNLNLNYEDVLKIIK